MRFVAGVCSALYIYQRKLTCRHIEAGSTQPRKLDISYPTTEFTKLVKMWERFDEATMGIVVRHVKRFGSTGLVGSMTN